LFHSAIACLLIGFLILFIVDQTWEYRNENGYVVSIIWGAVGAILMTVAFTYKRKSNKSRNIALPVDADGNIINSEKETASPEWRSKVLSQNKLKLASIFLILLGIYYSIMTIQISNRRESEILIYGFPLVILVFMILVSIVILPGFKANIRIIAKLYSLIVMCVLSPVAYYVYESHERLLYTTLLIIAPIVIAIGIVYFFRFLFRRLEDKKLLKTESNDE